MPNPKGNPESLEEHKLTTNRDDPLTETLTIRVSKLMKAEIKSQPDPAEFVRGAIQEKLDKLKDQVKE